MKKWIALSLLSVVACDDFKPGSLIADTRVLGAQVRVAGDPERSTPRPGETADVSFVIEGVATQPVVSWSLAVCLPTSAGCDELVQSSGKDTTPALRVVVPAESALGAAHALHVDGVICRSGEPDATRTGCVGDGADGTPLLYELSLARAANGEDENLQPNVEQARFKLDGKDWPEGQALLQGCTAQPELPQVFADEKEHRITIELGPDTRELHVGPDMTAMYEELQLSTFVDSGELERQFSFVTPDDERERPSVELKWTATKKKRLHGEDRGVRLLVLVRDSRGGLSRLERALCVVRPPSGQLSAAPPARPAHARPG